MTSYRIKRHRKRSHAEAGGHMTLVPFIDILTIMVVFLLFNTSDVDVLPNTKNIQIPQSISEKKPQPTVVIMITKDDLLVDGRSIMSVRDLIASPDNVIAPLKAALEGQADSVLKDAAKDDVKEREVTILGDRATPYSVMRKIMATATDANYGKVSLAVTSRETAPVSATGAGRTASLVKLPGTPGS
jgi:biopolymer transport protein TolR